MCCGVGGDAIKLANTCNKVIAYDCDINNLKCVEINKKIYGV
jgi:methylase of polypeptide subunit release factors